MSPRGQGPALAHLHVARVGTRSAFADQKQFDGSQLGFLTSCAPGDPNLLIPTTQGTAKGPSLFLASSSNPGNLPCHPLWGPDS